MLAAVDDDTRLLWLASPNNPTGAANSAAEIRQLAQAAPPHLVLAIDDAYGEFARASGVPDSLALLREFARPWVLLRTFSKAYGLAGLRVGYAFASSQVIAEALHRVRMTFNLSAIAQAGAAAAYEDEAYMLARVQACVAERESLHARLAAMNLACLPSAANFLSFALPVPGSEVAGKLRERGILVGEIKSPGYERFLRVTVGLADENAGFAAALAAIL
jgi:histidinol-phosphate aminotransferase